MDGVREEYGEMSPIRPENRGRYPKDWPEIRARILKRAGNKCEKCGAENYQPHPVTRSTVCLTIAHLDHTPENCEPINLRAMCNRCHLRYDHKHHMKNAKETRKKKSLLIQPELDFGSRS